MRAGYREFADEQRRISESSLASFNEALSGWKVLYSESIQMSKIGDDPWRWQATRNGERVGKGTAVTLKGALRRSRRAIEGKTKKQLKASKGP